MVVGEFTQEADVVVVGGGPGGYATAFRAAELGLKTVIVDPRGSLGGVCLHEGCIPSKTLLHVAETVHHADRAARFGVFFKKPRVDLEGVRAWTTKTISTLARGLENLCRKHGVEHIAGQGRFESSRSLVVRGGPVPRLRFRRAVIATGSRHTGHPVAVPDGRRIVTPEAAVALPDIPQRLLIIGNTYLAVELGSVYDALGSAVTLVDAAPVILPQADDDLVLPLRKALGEKFEGIHVSTRVVEATVDADGVDVRLEGPDAPAAARFDKVIAAVGRRANTEELGLETTSVSLDEQGFVEVDEQLRTTDARIWAAGDVTGPPLLADRALHQGRVVAEVLAGWGSAYDVRAVPHAVYTDPQLAWCGLTEREARARDISHRVVRTPWGASGRAVSMARTDGLTKIICDPDTHLVLGVGLVGPHATELIAEGALAIEMGAVTSDLAGTIHPHPTISELLSNASQSAESAPERAET